MTALALFVLSLPTVVPYHWQTVKIGGGGFVSGIITHPAKPGLVYARTDIGGAYRWDASAQKWIPLQDWLTAPDWNLYGVESLALDPNDPRCIYIAAGTYTNEWGHNGAILRSFDLGKTWNRVNLPFKNGGNMPGRSIGERLVVDPQAGNVLFFGTRNNGLYRSADRGASWTRVTSIGTVPRNDIGVGWVVFDPLPPKGPTKHLFAAVEGAERPIRESRDGGRTWREVSGQPTKLLPMQAKLEWNRKLIVVYSDFWGPNDVHNGSVWQLDLRDETWSDITPERPGGENTFGYAGVTVAREDPNVIMVSTLCRWHLVDTVFRTTDGGRHWTSLGDHAVRDTTPTPFLNWDKSSANFGHWIGDVELDPFNPDRAWYVTGATIYETEDLGAADRGGVTHWKPSVDGIEEVSVLRLLCPPQGAPLISALGDIGGFRHDDFLNSPPGGMWRNPVWSTTTDLDYAGMLPLRIVRVGWNGDHSAAISDDGARSWNPLASKPEGSRGAGTIALSSDGETILWAPEGLPPSRSCDGGQSWKASLGIKVAARVLSDKSDLQRFYAEAERSIWFSEDGGKSFVKGPDRFPLECGRLANPPGQPGDVWYPTPKGLYRAKSAHHFQRVNGIDSAKEVAFGKTYGQYPTIFVLGVRKGLAGVFRSSDEGRSWIKINPDGVGLGTMQSIAADPNKFGRVFVGTNGRGIWMGEVER